MSHSQHSATEMVENVTNQEPTGGSGPERPVQLVVLVPPALKWRLRAIAARNHESLSRYCEAVLASHADERDKGAAA